MARSRIPGPLERRHLLDRPLDASRARAIAEAYLAAGRSVEAVAFLGRAGEAAPLEALADEAIEAGDAFLLEMVSRELETTPGPDRWRRLAENARAAGLLAYAASAERHVAAAE